jgi:hypothetical protein
MSYEPTAATLNTIRNTLSNYCIALDTKEFNLLHKVFAPNVICDYTAVSPTNPAIIGIEKFLERIQIILKGRITQHALSTQRLEFEEKDGKVICQAFTYFTANTFTTEEGELNHVSVFGYYEDLLKETENGGWRIFERKVNSFVSFVLIEMVSVKTDENSIRGLRIVRRLHRVRDIERAESREQNAKSDC